MELERKRKHAQPAAETECARLLYSEIWDLLVVSRVQAARVYQVVGLHGGSW